METNQNVPGTNATKHSCPQKMAVPENLGTNGDKPGTNPTKSVIARVIFTRPAEYKIQYSMTNRQTPDTQNALSIVFGRSREYY